MRLFNNFFRILMQNENLKMCYYVEIFLRERDYKKFTIATKQYEKEKAPARIDECFLKTG